MSKIKSWKKILPKSFYFLTIVLTLAKIFSCKTIPSSSEVTDHTLSQTTAFVFENIRPENLRNLAIKEYERFKIASSLKIIDLNAMNVASMSGRYKYELSRQGDGLHARSDSWRLGLGLAPGTALIGGPTPLSLQLNITVNSDVVFTRIFETKEKAALALPRTLLDLPTNAEKADQLNIGEIVTMPLTMGVRVGPAIGWNVQNIGLSSSAGVFWSGKFVLAITRVSANIFSLKVTPGERWGYNLAAFAGYNLNYFGYGPMGLFSFDKVLTKELGLDLLQYTNTRVAQGRSGHLEYFYNFGSKDAVNAFNHALNSVLKISEKSKILLKPGLSERADLHYLDFGLSETLTELDQSKPIESRRVTSAKIKENIYNGSFQSAQIGTKFLRYNNGASLSFNSLIDYEHEQPTSTTYFHHLAINRKKSSFWTIVKESESIGVTGIQKISYSGKQSKEKLDFIFNWNKSDANLSASEFSTYIHAVKNLLNLDDKDPLIMVKFG